MAGRVFDVAGAKDDCLIAGQTNLMDFQELCDPATLRQLFEAISLVDDAHLVVAGFGPDYERYQTIASALPHASRIHFAGPVPPAEIAEWTRGADVAAMPVISVRNCSSSNMSRRAPWERWSG